MAPAFRRRRGRLRRRRPRAGGGRYSRTTSMATGTADRGIARGRSWAEALGAPTRDWLGDLRRTTPALSIAILSLLVVLPLAVMLIASFRPAGTFPLDPGPLVLSNFADAYFTPNTLAMLSNTAVFASVPLLFSLPLAFGLAF